MLGIKSNMGRLDRVFRLLIGGALLYIGLLNGNLIQNDIVRYLLAILGGINTLSALISFCPMYVVANIDTRKKA